MLLFLNSLKKNFHITCVDPNKNMIKAGKRKLNELVNNKDVEGWDDPRNYNGFSWI